MPGGFGGFGLTEVEESLTAAGVPLVSAVVPEREHDQVWRALREEHPRTGWWPVLTWMAPKAHALSHGYSLESQGAEALALALAEDPAEVMAELTLSQWEEWLNDTEPVARMEVWRENFDVAALAAQLEPVVSPPPGRRRETSSSPPGRILLVQAAAGYEVPVLVPGLIEPANWSGGPSHALLWPADHVAVLRLWHERHGADFFFAGGSSLELSVARPPADRAEVARCALEQYVYCDDLSQTLGDPVRVAREQVPADHWSFWWD
jgi:hypothetical protein